MSEVLRLSILHKSVLPVVLLPGRVKTADPNIVEATHRCATEDLARVVLQAFVPDPAVLPAAARRATAAAALSVRHSQQSLVLQRFTLPYVCSHFWFPAFSPHS